MGIAVTNLTTSSTTTDATSYNTASVSPAANALLLVGVQVGVTTGSPTVTVSGLGLTWVLVDQTVVVVGGRTLYVFRAMTGSSPPTPGAVTISTGVTANACLWNVVQFIGIDPSGTNGSGAIDQSVNAKPATTNSISVAFGSAPDTGNVRYACVGVAVAEQPAVGSGWTALGAGQSVSNLVNGFRAMYSDPPQTNITATWTTAANAFVVGVEIKAAVAPPIQNPYQRLQSILVR